MSKDFSVGEELAEITSNIKGEMETALYGPMGIISNPVRFGFYALILGTANILIIQAISGGINRAMNKD
jgi:hypothetical protein